MAEQKRPTAYVSFCGKANGMLALWIDHHPVCNAEQRDPAGWTTGVSEATDYVIERLCDLSKCPDARIVRLTEHAAEWWEHIDATRKRKVKAAERERTKDAQSLFAIPDEIESQGRNEGFIRTRHKREAKVKRTA